MKLAEILEANLDDIGTPVQGLGGSISGNVPNVLPSGTLKDKQKWAEKLKKMKKRQKKRKEEECEFSVNF